MAKKIVRKISVPQRVQSTKVLETINNLKPKSYNQILVVLLVISAFLIGVLYTKVSYLEKGTTTNNQAAVPDQNTQQPAVIPPGTKVDVDNGHFPVLGDKNAKVVIVDFSDFECPFCKQYFDQTFIQLKKDYIDTGKVAYYYRHFPLSFHPAAKPSALASECANEQGKFWEFHDLVFTEQAKITGQTPEGTIQALKAFAANLNLNTTQFNSCLDLEKYKDNVDKDVKEGGVAGVSGTPTFFINGVSLVGAQPYASFKTAIDQELSK